MILDDVAREALELQRTRRNDPLDLCFPAQREMVQALLEPGARVVDHSGRRGAKTEGCAHGAIKLLRNPRRKTGNRVAWVGLTRQSAMDNVWPVMRRVNDRLDAGLTPHETKGRWYSPDGGEFRVMGANKVDETEKIRGEPWDLVIIDESASFRRSLLRYLIDDVVDPTLADYNGGLGVIGTPGAACVGAYHDLCTNPRGKWRVFRRTMLDNPHIPHAAEWLANKRAEKGWDEQHPTYLREYMGLWVRDSDTLVFALARDRNVIPSMPEDYYPGSPHWVHVLSHDYGVKNSTAFVVLAWRKNLSENRVYVVESFKWHGAVPEEYIDGLGIPREEGLIASNAARITSRLVAKYKPLVTIGDAGGIGAEYIATAQQTFGIPVRNAPKLGKLGQITLVNDGLEAAQLVIVEDGNQDLLDEMELLQWATSLKEVNIQGVIRFEEQKDTDKRFEDHLCDAFRYGFALARTYVNNHSVKVPEVFSSPDAETGARISREMRKKVEKRRKQAWWEGL